MQGAEDQQSLLVDPLGHLTHLTMHHRRHQSLTTNAAPLGGQQYAFLNTLLSHIC